MSHAQKAVRACDINWSALRVDIHQAAPCRSSAIASSTWLMPGSSRRLSWSRTSSFSSLSMTCCDSLVLRAFSALSAAALFNGLPVVRESSGFLTEIESSPKGYTDFQVLPSLMTAPAACSAFSSFSKCSWLSNQSHLLYRSAVVAPLVGMLSSNVCIVWLLRRLWVSEAVTFSVGEGFGDETRVEYVHVIDGLQGILLLRLKKVVQLRKLAALGGYQFPLLGVARSVWGFAVDQHAHAPIEHQFFNGLDVNRP
ncbi:hypothetical protein HCH_02858 [Hahella chejuensis KCTC 2396]|uniref:Uncharacterized protein n=1 Tax=Hahella chejuensis (strain KCTC 2396) TaxID=349521 RepID=Q2SI91_HAHCH|nr:hypothetical protein HCH_02858 [Hahella chejuensis KCTC 2396]